MALMLAVGGAAGAQDLEPRAYSNAPVGMGFLLTGYGISTGDVAFDAATPIDDADLTSHFTFVAFAQVLDLWDRAAKFDVVIPYGWVSGSARLMGQPVSRHTSGPGDPRLRLSMLFHGAPALSFEEFKDYRQDFIVGGSLAVTAPLGRYDDSKLVNIGTNRWSFEPELGVSKTLGPVTLELATSVTLYTNNDRFLDEQRLKRDPLYAVQGHLIYRTRLGIWAALDATYYAGGRAEIDGVSGDLQESLRWGGTLAFPLDARRSIKIFGSLGAISRAGGDFDTAGIAWQVRLGG